MGGRDIRVFFFRSSRGCEGSLSLSLETPLQILMRGKQQFPRISAGQRGKSFLERRKSKLIRLSISPRLVHSDSRSRVRTSFVNGERIIEVSSISYLERLTVEFVSFPFFPFFHYSIQLIRCRIRCVHQREKILSIRSTIHLERSMIHENGIIVLYCVNVELYVLLINTFVDKC